MIKTILDDLKIAAYHAINQLKAAGGDQETIDKVKQIIRDIEQNDIQDQQRRKTV